MLKAASFDFFLLSIFLTLNAQTLTYEAQFKRLMSEPNEIVSAFVIYPWIYGPLQSLAFWHREILNSAMIPSRPRQAIKHRDRRFCLYSSVIKRRRSSLRVLLQNGADTTGEQSKPGSQSANEAPYFRAPITTPATNADNFRVPRCLQNAGPDPATTRRNSRPGQRGPRDTRHSGYGTISVA